MAQVSSQSPESSAPRRRRRLLWIILAAAVGTIAVRTLLGARFKYVSHGYLPATQQYGYGYVQRNLVKDHMLWRTVPPGSAILWKAEKMPAFTETDLTVDGHHVYSPGGPRKTVYALQPDYTLKRIPLSDQEVDRVFALVEEAKQNGIFREDEFWQTRIEPELSLVGSQQESQAPATNPTDARPGAE